MASATQQPQVIPTLTTPGLTELLLKAIPKRRPVLIAGAPGIGKSDIVAQVAQQLGFDLIIFHPAISDPTDFKGLPWFDSKSKVAEFYPLGDLAKLVTATRPTLAFFEDLGQAPEGVQAALMQLFLARRIGQHIVSDFVTFIGATNGRQHRAGVRGILETVKSRFMAIIELLPDIESWSRWANSNGVSPMLIAFLRYRPELLSKFEPSADLTNSPCPRTWNHVAQIEDLDLSAGVESVAMAGAVGIAAATEYITFRRLHKSLVNVDAILTNPDKAAIPSAPSELYAVSIALAGRANTQNFGRVIRYAQRMADAQRGEFAVLTVRSATDRDESLVYTDAYIKAQASSIGQLISGSN